MIQLEYDLYQAFGIIIGSFILYLILHFPFKRKELRLGLLLFAYVRDINLLLTSKLLKEWSDLGVPKKLEMLKAIYDVIANFDDLETGDKIEKKPDIDQIVSGLDSLNKHTEHDLIIKGIGDKR